MPVCVYVTDVCSSIEKGSCTCYGCACVCECVRVSVCLCVCVCAYCLRLCSQLQRCVRCVVVNREPPPVMDVSI
jgi:hypothetical protein